MPDCAVGAPAPESNRLTSQRVRMEQVVKLAILAALKHGVHREIPAPVFDLEQERLHVQIEYHVLAGGPSLKCTNMVENVVDIEGHFECEDVRVMLTDDWLAIRENVL